MAILPLLTVDTDGGGCHRPQPLIIATTIGGDAGDMYFTRRTGHVRSIIMSNIKNREHIFWDTPAKHTVLGLLIIQNNQREVISESFYFNSESVYASLTTL